jgi:hypothetical protein
MPFCRTVELLYEAVPLRLFRDWLIRAHMDKCPACQSRLLSLDEARGLLVAPGQVGDAGTLWRRIAAAAGRADDHGAPRPVPSGIALKWASAAVVALAVTLTGFWLLREAGRPGHDAAAARFEIAYVNVGGAPAQTFVYQPQGSDTVFVWAQKTP